MFAINDIQNPSLSPVHFSLKEKDGKEVALFLKNCAGDEVVKNLGAKRGNIAET